jgi:hypothetical protein
MRYLKAMIISKIDLYCDDCGDKVTAQEMREDTMRMHKTREGQILCECCYEDFLEKFHPSEE